MSTILDRLPDNERQQILNCSRGTLEDLCISLGLNYHSVRAAKSRLKLRPLSDEIPDDLIDDVSGDLSDDEPAIGSYYFDHVLRQYVTRLRQAPEAIIKSEAEHKRLLRLFSSWSGKPAKLDALSRDFGLPVSWLKEYARVHGWQRQTLPFTAEEMEERSVEDLAEEVDVMKEVALRRRVHEKEQERIQRKAAAFDTIEQQLWKFVDALPETYKAPLLWLPRVDPGDTAVILSTADLHFGKYSYGPEIGGQGYDRQIARDCLIETTTDLLARILRYGTPGKFLVVIGGDDEHVDTVQRTTTAGTPQDVDGTAVQAAIEFSALLRDYLELIRQVGVPMEIYTTRGNHNSLTSLYRALEIQAFYRDTSNVTVYVTPAPRTYVLHGHTLIGLTHGDGPKVNDLPVLMATEVPELWGKSTHRAWFLQHLHHEAMIEKIGVKLYRLPSLSGVDRWHAEKGYISSPAAAAYLVEPTQGVVGTILVSRN